MPSPRQTFDFGFFRVRNEPGYGWIMERPPAVVVVPLGPGHSSVWLARIERVPTRHISWELPGGAVDGGENVIEAALRELHEECGLVATEGAKALRCVLELAPGMGRFPHYVVVARGVLPARRRAVPQIDEGVLAVRRFTSAGVRRLIGRGEISVHATLAALATSGFLMQPPDAPRRI